MLINDNQIFITESEYKAHIEALGESNCCEKPVKVINGDEGTSYFQCTKCKQACDLKEVSGG